jgi:hypothetical protein
VRRCRGRCRRLVGGPAPPWCLHGGARVWPHSADQVHADLAEARGVTRRRLRPTPREDRSLQPPPRSPHFSANRRRWRVLLEDPTPRARADRRQWKRETRSRDSRPQPPQGRRPKTIAPLRRAERFSHALYGLIIITAVLVAERPHVESAADALGLLFGTAVVLLVVHTYSSVMAVRLVAGHRLEAEGRRLVLRDNAPVSAAVVVPAVAFGLAAADVVSLETAFPLPSVCLRSRWWVSLKHAPVASVGREVC